MNETSIVFVGNLPWSTTNEELHAIMFTAGQIVTCEIQHHDRSSRSKGWGLVKYVNHEEAVVAASTLDGVEINSRKLHVRLDRSVSEGIVHGHVVFLGNIPWNFTDDNVSELFLPYNAYDSHVLRNMAGRSRGFALSTFLDESNAMRAITEVHGNEIGGRVVECRMNRENASQSFATIVRNSVTVRGIVGSIDDKALRTHFSVAGEILSIRMSSLKDDTRAVVEFSNRKQCVSAMALHESTLLGCVLQVKLNRK